MIIIKKYKLFLEKLEEMKYIPTYEEALEMCAVENSPFYEIKNEVNGFPISVFNYRLAEWSDFNNPLKNNPIAKGHEMRGITYVFNKDGSLFKRFILLEKFFNLNQTPESMYSVVKDFKIKHINNKEDGSIASFIQLPDGTIVGKSKMGFDNEQAIGINKLYKNNKDIKLFVDYCFNNDITPIFEYVGPRNRIVLRYKDEELILLRLRNNNTGEHLEILEYLDKIGSIKIAPFEDEHTLDELIDLAEVLEDKEGWVVQTEEGMFKVKTKFYFDRHGLLTNDLYREHVIINYILDEKIDDVLAQVPEDEVEAHERINRIIEIVKSEFSKLEKRIIKEYDNYIKSGITRKEYALNNRKGNPLFGFIMSLVTADELKKLNREEILEIYDTMEDYDIALSRLTPQELVKEFLKKKTKRLEIAREWLFNIDPTLNFLNSKEEDDE